MRVGDRTRLDALSVAISEDPADRDRDQHPPAEPHELVVAQPRQRAAQPHEDEQEHEDLGEEPEDRPPALVGSGPQRGDRRRHPPAAEEQRRRDGGDVDHVDVLGEEEHRPAQAGVLRVEAGDELALGLGQVERCPVRLADHRDAVDDEGRQQQESTTCRPGPRRSARSTSSRHRGTPPRRRGPSRSRRRSSARSSAGRRAGSTSSPTTSRRARCRRCRSTHREDVEHGHREVGDLQRRLDCRRCSHRADRDDREGEERARRGDHRRQQVDEHVGVRAG